MTMEQSGTSENLVESMHMSPGEICRPEKRNTTATGLSGQDKISYDMQQYELLVKTTHQPNIFKQIEDSRKTLITPWRNLWNRLSSVSKSSGLGGNK